MALEQACHWQGTKLSRKLIRLSAAFFQPDAT
jgi:hypothetical protein